MSKVKYRVREFTPKAGQAGSHSFFAEGLLTSAASHYGENENYSCGSGGFMAHLDETTLTLQFVLTETTSYADDFIKID